MTTLYSILLKYAAVWLVAVGALYLAALTLRHTKR